MEQGLEHCLYVLAKRVLTFVLDKKNQSNEACAESDGERPFLAVAS